MNTEVNSLHNHLHIGAKRAGVIFLLVLVGYMLADAALNEVLNYLRSSEDALTLRGSEEGEIEAIKIGVGSVVSPCFVFVLALSVLRCYFPRAPFRNLLVCVGFTNVFSKRTMLFSFLGGITLVLFLTEIVQPFFPPNEFVVPDPASAINGGSLWVKILFAVSVVCFVPVVEEFLFRGVLYVGIAQSSNKMLSAAIVSAIFILLHPDSISSGYWFTHAVLFTFPFLLVLLREVTGSLYGPILLHAGFNFAEVLF